MPWLHRALIWVPRFVLDAAGRILWGEDRYFQPNRKLTSLTFRFFNPSSSHRSALWFQPYLFKSMGILFQRRSTDSTKRRLRCFLPICWKAVVQPSSLVFHSFRFSFIFFGGLETALCLGLWVLCESKYSFTLSVNLSNSSGRCSHSIGFPSSSSWSSSITMLSSSFSTSYLHWRTTNYGKKLNPSLLNWTSH